MFPLLFFKLIISCFPKQIYCQRKVRPLPDLSSIRLLQPLLKIQLEKEKQNKARPINQYNSTGFRDMEKKKRITQVGVNNFKLYKRSKTANKL